MQDLAEKLFPDIREIPGDILAKYQKRPNGMVVTRMAPSPTGFLHIGAIYSAMLDNIVATKNNGVFFLRIEDTDQKREIQGASQKFVDIFKIFGLEFSEGPIGENYQDVGEYGPYTQSQREYIYKVFIKDLVQKGFAYPCFLTEDEITQTRAIQEASKLPTGIYKEYSPWRYASLQEVEDALSAGREFVIRFKSLGEISRKIEVHDLIKGNVVMQENFLDIVICKKTGIPTYHFAHLIDDYLMGTTHVIRSDEWFASLPLHNQLFQTLGWKSPQYAHYGPLVKIDGDSRRKLSKRKDVEADVEYYFQEGYLISAIQDFLSNIINAGFEEWRKENLNESYLNFDFQLQRVNTAGALVDLDKLNFVNATTIKNMPLNELYHLLKEYLKTYENSFYMDEFSQVSDEYNLKILGELQTRLITLKDYKKLTSFFYNEPRISNDTLGLLVNPKMKISHQEEAKRGLEIACEVLNMLSTGDNFDEVKNSFVDGIAKHGMKNGQVLWPVRVALSAEEFSPGALELIVILGKEKSIQRISKILQLL